MTISPSFEQCSIQMGVIDAEIVKQSLGIVQLKRRRNQFIPIAQLPSELLLDIFEYYISSANERYLDSISIQVSPYNWIRITHICHHWRQTVLQCAKMWIRIVLGHHTPHEWMQELLKRSQDLSLIVEATSPIPVVCTDVTKPLLRPMVDYGILERTRELHLTDLKAPVQAHHSDILGIIPIGNRGISPARLSKIKAVNCDVLLLMQPRFVASLENLHLHRCSARTIDHHSFMTLDKLRTLSLSTFSTSLNCHVLISLLGSAPWLESLTLTRVLSSFSYQIPESPHDRPKITIKTLRNLSIMDEAEHCYHFLPMLSLDQEKVSLELHVLRSTFEESARLPYSYKDLRGLATLASSVILPQSSPRIRYLAIFPSPYNSLRFLGWDSANDLSAISEALRGSEHTVTEARPSLPSPKLDIHVRGVRESCQVDKTIDDIISNIPFSADRVLHVVDLPPLCISDLSRVIYITSTSSSGTFISTK
ncbi:hypothetical protein ABKN59_010971 [Abortiporus biennis]